jgi:hypothetical protein
LDAILDAIPMCVPGHEMPELAKLAKMRELAKMLENYGFLKGNVGGGGRSRTAAAADMSRDDSDEGC